MDDNATIGKYVVEAINKAIAALMQYEDIETGILIYRELGGYIEQMEAVKARAKDLVKNCLMETGEQKAITSSGTAGWTIPKTPKLDKKLWEQALDDNPSLRTVVDNYEKAAAMLDEVQAPYKVLPPPALFIR